MYGIPVICTSSYGIRDMFNEGFAFMDPKSCITIERIKAKERFARKEYLKRYTLGKMQRRYLSLLMDLSAAI